MAQFKSSPVDFVLSKIILTEVAQHLKNQLEKSKDDIEGALSNASRTGLVLDEHKAQLDAAAGLLRDPRTIAIERIKQFFRETGGRSVEYELADMTTVVRYYFRSIAPFEPKKKSEFPDAIALLSLEAWAEENDRRILAISDDSGWLKYGETSDRIDVESDLAHALSTFQDHDQQVRRHVIEFFTALEAGELNVDAEQIETDIDLGLALHNIDVEATPDFNGRVELEGEYLDLTSYEFQKSDGVFDFDIIETAKAKITLQIFVDISATAHVDAGIYVNDSIDRDEVYLGSNHLQQDYSDTVSVMITLEGDFDEGPVAVSATDVQVLEMVHGYVDFGSVEPDFSDDHDPEFEFAFDE